MKFKKVHTYLAIAVVGILFAYEKTPNTSAYLVVEVAETKAMDSEEAFHKMMDVLTHQRCMNCHPTDNIPKQGDDRHPHYFGIARGDDNMGFEATNCNTCHQSENNEYSGVPGAPHWSLAPASTGWQGLSRTELAERLLDREMNGNRNHEELIEHMTEDALVLWAWKPGVDPNGLQRELPPVSKEEFKKAVEDWFNAGAIIPTK